MPVLVEGCLIVMNLNVEIIPPACVSCTVEIVPAYLRVGFVLLSVQTCNKKVFIPAAFSCSNKNTSEFTEVASCSLALRTGVSPCAGARLTLHDARATRCVDRWLVILMLGQNLSARS